MKTFLCIQTLAKCHIQYIKTTQKRDEDNNNKTHRIVNGVYANKKGEPTARLFYIIFSLYFTLFTFNFYLPKPSA